MHVISFEPRSKHIQNFICGSTPNLMGSISSMVGDVHLVVKERELGMPLLCNGQNVEEQGHRNFFFN